MVFGFKLNAQCRFSSPVHFDAGNHSLLHSGCQYDWAWPGNDRRGGSPDPEGAAILDGVIGGACVAFGGPSTMAFGTSYLIATGVLLILFSI